MTTQTKRRIRVLVIDDSSTTRIAASKVFGEEFDVLLAIDGEDGLDVIQSDNQIQVVFTDLVMPEMDGFELLKHIRKHQKKRIQQLPVIVMTGAENPDLAKEKALKLGATDFITKPFDPTAIRARAFSYSRLSDTATKLRQTSTLDELTGLLNPRGFIQQLEKGIAFGARHAHQNALMCIEIDDYKSLFVSMGRSGAERLIRRIGVLLQQTLRKEDSIGRLGVARFCVFIPLINQEHALESANNICQKVENIKATLKGKRLALSVSAGIAHHKPEMAIKPQEILKLSNRALAHACALGRSQIYLLNTDVLAKKAVNEMLSIDSLIECIHSGQEHLVADKLNDALEQLAPLIALLSHEQKQHLITQRR